MNSAVMKPHAMKAAMFGRTMLDKKVPNLCTCTRAPVRGAAVVDAIEVPPTSDRHVTPVTFDGRQFAPLRANCQPFGQVFLPVWLVIGPIGLFWPFSEG